MFGSVSEYFYKYLAGIHAPTDQGTSAGYKHIHIKPYVPEQLSWVDASIETMYGNVRSRWEMKNGTLSLSVNIPANTSGKISIPTLGYQNVTVLESGDLLWDFEKFNRVEGISEGSKNDGFLTFNVQSGEYHFELSKTN